MAVIQSLIDNGTDIEVTIIAPVDNVDIHVNFYTDLLDGKPIAKNTCLIRPTTLDTFTIKTSRENYAGLNVYVQVKINPIGMPSQVLLDETCEPITVSGTNIVSINDITK